MNDVPIMVCACGKRLRAPGAVPGRVGRCPACGCEMRVPEEAVREVVEEGPRTEEVKPRKKKRKGNPQGRGHETAIWDGLIKAPEKPEGMGQSLLYPFWGATGIASLVVLPPLLWIASLPLVTGIMTWIQGTSFFGIGVFFLNLPALIALGVVGGYTLLFLGRVAASSAMGEMHHPRWPEWELTSILFGLGRWVWAAIIGGLVGGIPATAYWVYCGDIDLFDALVLIELTGLGAVYALMALLASILHEDALAANPITVVQSIWRSGWGYARPCLLAGAAVLVAFTLLAAALKVNSPEASAFLYWLFWVVFLYESMVVLRVLGLFYHEHARELGWFPSRSSGWGV